MARVEKYLSHKTKTIKIRPVVPEITASEGLILLVVLPKLVAVSASFSSSNLLPKLVPSWPLLKLVMFSTAEERKIKHGIRDVLLV